MKQITGNKLLVKALKEEGVEYLFGYPGACTIDISDELYKQDEIKIVLPRHEQALVHEADAYARTTGKVGVCLVTSGPGATNLVTGIATAYMDSVPVVAITCNVANSLLGKDSFQEIDIAGVTMPITKHNYIVKDVNNLADTIRKAFVIAKEGRPGPVLIDIPKDVTGNKAEYEPVKIQPIVKYKKEICMEDIDKEFVNQVKSGDLIVADKNFGCGSSREHAPIAIKAAGVSCVIAETFARIFYRNAINIGLPIIECPAAAKGIEAGDEVEVDFDTGVITNVTKGTTFQGQPFPEFMQKIIKAEGLVNYINQK